MNTQIPLEHLIINLLALAEVAPQLASEPLAEVAALASEATPDVDSLARVGTQILIVLHNEKAFLDAKQAWGDLIPARHALQVDKVNAFLSESNPKEKPSTAPEDREDPEMALRNLSEAAQQLLRSSTKPEQEPLLRRLAGILGLEWPRKRAKSW